MPTDKSKFLEDLNYAYCQLQKTYLQLLEDGRINESEKLEVIILALSALVEDVTNDALEDWIIKAGKLHERSVTTLSEIRGYVDDIEKDIKNAEKITKAIYSLDKALGKLFKVLS